MKPIKRHQRHQDLLIAAPERIVRLEGNINYTTFVLFSGKRRTMSYTLKTYHKLLDDTFLRVSRCCIINLNFIETLDLEEKKIWLKDGTEISISRRYWMQIRKETNVLSR